MNKTAIKNFAIWARNKLIADVRYRAGLVGITEKGVQTALPQSDSATEFYDIGTATPYALSGHTRLRQRRNLAGAIRRRAEGSDYPSAYRYIMEETAYTWFNRLIAVRFMEVNDYLPGRVRALSSESGKIEPDLVTTPFDAELNFTAEEERTVLQLKQDNKLDELFRLLFIKQCNALHDILPALFERRSDYTELLLNLSVVDQDGVVWRLTHDIPEDDFNVDQGGQVEIIGWLYQYYNTEPKAQVFARPSGQKIRKEDIPAATQLFTPDWIVRYMVENSLGRLWLEGHPDEGLRTTWKYYLDEAEQEPEVQAQLEELRAERRTLNPEDIKIIDPCMGSGHILAYAFDVLMQIYESQGYSPRDAAQSIVRCNLYGLDIDKRAAQLAYFAVMMKARQYDRRFFSRNLQPMVYSTSGDEDGENFGSLLIVDEPGEMPEEPQSVFDLPDYERRLSVWNYRVLLAQKYHVVVTNPPYMGASNMNSELSNFIKNKYVDFKSDYFSAFMMRCTYLTRPTGFLGFFSPYVWMFIQSYEKLRNCFCNDKTIETLIQFEYSAFEEATVPVCTFVLRNNHFNKKGCYLRLTDFRGGMEVQRQKVLEAIDNHSCGYYFEQSADNFSKIPGAPVAYWVSETMLSVFTNGRAFGGETKKGVLTGDNSRFLRIWHEVGINNIGFQLSSQQDMIVSRKKWFPVTSGGEKRKWYGNFDTVVNLKDDGAEIKAVVKNYRLRDPKYYMAEAITWTEVSSGVFSCRYVPSGILFGNGGPVSFFRFNDLLYHLGLLNSNVAMEMLKYLAPTINYGPEQIDRVPVIEKNNEYVDKVVTDNIALSRSDWDSFETSWDFKRHPLLDYMEEAEREIPVVRYNENGTYSDSDIEIYVSVENAFLKWQAVCEERFQQLKANEEELNRIFIDIYGLQEELTPEVEEKDVTVRRAELGRDIRSLLSYAVGCMFGRYSLDVEGLAYAGGNFDSVYRKDRLVDDKGNPITLGGISISVSKDYTYISHDGTWIEATFPVDGDNILPLTDEAYLEDDIVSRLCQWLQVVYGPDTLEENLDFIAKALGNKGATARESIRSYFLKDFFADHCKIYQKRPIYWLFDSGRQNGFKALIYLHRYTPDTIGKLRVDYLHRLQRVYASEIERMQDMIDNSKNQREVAVSAKRKEKLQKQLKECREYDEKIALLALARIALDLDDGVKVNYEKVQTAADGKKYPVLGKI